MASPNWVRMRRVPSQHRRSHGRRDRSGRLGLHRLPAVHFDWVRRHIPERRGFVPAAVQGFAPGPGTFPRRCGEQLPGVRPDQRNLQGCRPTRRMSGGWPYRARTISTRSSVRLVPIPVFQKIAVSTMPGRRSATNSCRMFGRPTMPRSEIRRTAYVVTTGNPDLITHLIGAELCGQGYQFTESPFTTAVSAIPYVLDDFEVRELASGGVAIRYEFLTRCPTAEIRPTPTPTSPSPSPLTFLQEWNISYPIGSPPQITAVMPPIEVGDSAVVNRGTISSTTALCRRGTCPVRCRAMDRWRLIRSQASRTRSGVRQSDAHAHGRPSDDQFGEVTGYAANLVRTRRWCSTRPTTSAGSTACWNARSSRFARTSSRSRLQAIRLSPEVQSELAQIARSREVER